ncbi:MAG: hypothetical protein JNK02_15750 [Planctomycetes bacterium]|nr:hypothetical protein [Planctomycetota bacterium]
MTTRIRDAATGALLALALLAPARAQDPSAPPANGTPPQAAAQAGEPAAPPHWAPRYRAPADVAAWVEAWVATGLAARVALPASRGGREAPALSFGAAGGPPLEQRPTVFLVGGLDGASLAGAEGALRAADELLRRRDALPRAIAFVCVPWAAPDGLARTLEGGAADGRDLLPVDDDGDLAFDEDGPDDVDGDGLVLEMLVEDPEGPWTRGSDGRFLVRAASTDRLRYRRVPEGRDDDGDGRYNEDPPGGVVLDLAFPVGWHGEPGGLGGALPLDDDLSRALADLILARPRLAVLLFQGNHGLLARPGGVEGLAWSSGPGSAADLSAVRHFAEATGRRQAEAIPLHRARAEPRPGAALDWIHAVAGALAAEVGVWGPLEERGAVRVQASAPEALVRREEGVEAAWARWLDDVRGGIGFVDWHPVDLGDGRSALVGGWQPFARANPPEECLEGATAGLASFVEKLAAAAPALELRVVEAARDGEVVTVRARVENSGRLATGLAGADGARLSLALPSGARLLWGEVEARLGVLEPGTTSREVTAVALVPPGGVLRLVARAPWAAPVEREVKP